MGIPEGVVPEGWWIGFKVTDDEVWEKVKDGAYPMFPLRARPSARKRTRSPRTEYR